MNAFVHYCRHFIVPIVINTLKFQNMQFLKPNNKLRNVSYRKIPFWFLTNQKMTNLPVEKQWTRKHLIRDKKSLLKIKKVKWEKKIVTGIKWWKWCLKTESTDWFLHPASVSSHPTHPANCWRNIHRPRGARQVCHKWVVKFRQKSYWPGHNAREYLGKMGREIAFTPQNTDHWPGKLLTYPPSSRRWPSCGSHRGGMYPDKDIEDLMYRQRDPEKRHHHYTVLFTLMLFLYTLKTQPIYECAIF